ncbi:MAG: NTP transferase domain-containing protein [Patescibacteria group bacterium]|jgi:bifunctional UDP-N-acetylglucosamine pyrophosphorylase/glucosamine-1-phosphate N-acetyltransferase|nr:NTP transferase domain-containing protein [Patescibacteria group bacterium]
MTQVVILAAGKGKRMQSDLPKVMHTLNGQPMIDYLIQSVINSGLTSKPILIINPESDLIQQHLSDKCYYAIQSQQLGTGHALACAKDLLIQQSIDNVAVLNGDGPLVKTTTLQKLHQIHQEHQSVLSMLTVKVPNFENQWQTFEKGGRILRNNQNQIIGIREFKDATDDEKQITEINPSLFMFQTDWLWKNIDQLNNQNNSNEYYITDLVGLAIQQGHQIPTVQIPPEQGIGINTQEHLKLAEQILNQNLF